MIAVSWGVALTVLGSRAAPGQKRQVLWVAAQIGLVQGILAWIVVRGMVDAARPVPTPGASPREQALEIVVFLARSWVWLVAFFGFGIWRVSWLSRTAAVVNSDGTGGALIGAEISMLILWVMVIAGAFGSLFAQGMSGSWR
jgi:hypothetical protein